jgi:hypothetical protein
MIEDTKRAVNNISPPVTVRVEALLEAAVVAAAEAEVEVGEDESSFTQTLLFHPTALVSNVTSVHYNKKSLVAEAKSCFSMRRYLI